MIRRQSNGLEVTGDADDADDDLSGPWEVWLPVFAGGFALGWILSYLSR